jgi:hypothetical protein
VFFFQTFRPSPVTFVPPPNPVQHSSFAAVSLCIVEASASFFFLQTIAEKHFPALEIAS